MKEKLVIASYGGSGSTFLAHEINSNGQYSVAHTHACPDLNNERLGIPVFNQLTGGAEGPFSKSCFLSEEIKVIIIVRKPSEAYDSRAGFKHFCHLWSGSSYFDEILGNKKLPIEEFGDVFRRKWKACLDDKIDVMNLSGWLDNWFKYSKISNHEIYFLKYEDIAIKEKELAEFLNIPLSFTKFSPSERVVKSPTLDIFKSLDTRYDSLNSKKLSRVYFDTKPKEMYKPKLQNVSFHIKGMRAGAGDAISRLGKVYLCIDFLLGAKVSVEHYVNYHCKELDFLSLYGVRDLLDKGDNENCVALSLKDFSYYCLYSRDFFITNEKVTYEIDLTDQSEMRYLDKLIREFDIPRNFLKYLSYKPSESIEHYFSKGTFKVVAHFRRNDILGKIFCPEIERGPIGKYGLHSRRLVEWEDIDQVIKNLELDEQKIEVLLISDGVSKQTLLASKKEGVEHDVLNVIDSLDTGGPNGSNITVVQRVIGNEADKTITALNAMFYADLVISGSSVFPNIICHIGKTKLVKVE